MSAIYRDEGAALRSALEVELSTTRERIAALRARLGASTPALDRFARRMLRPVLESASVSELAARADVTRAKNARLDLEEVIIEAEADDLPPPAGVREGLWPPLARVTEHWPGHLRAPETEAHAESLLDAFWELLADAPFGVWDDLEQGVPVHYFEAKGARLVLGTDGARCGGVVLFNEPQAPLALEPRRLASAVRELVGWSSDPQLGDRSFDAAFDLKGSLRWVSHALTHELREALLSFERSARVRLRVEDRTGAIAWDGAPSRAALEAASRVLIGLAERGMAVEI